MGLPDWPRMGLSIHVGTSPYVAAELCFNSEVPLASSLQARIWSWQGRVGKVEEEQGKCGEEGPQLRSDARPPGS